VLQNKIVVGVVLSCLVIVSLIGAKSLGYFDVVFERRILQERPLFRLAYLIVEAAIIKINLAQSEKDVWNLVRDACEGLEMGSIEIESSVKDKANKENLQLSMQRKKASIFTLSQNGNTQKLNSIELDLNELDTRVIIKYWQPDVSTELETEIPRLVVSLIKKAQYRVRLLRAEKMMTAGR
jgi:hypothetical protein